MRLLSLLLLCTALVLAGGVLSGCDNSLDPIDGDRGFSIYGTLSMNTDRQVIRVRDLNAPFTSEATQDFDATVELVNETTGKRLPMQKSVSEFEDVYVYNFIRTVDLSPDAPYRVVVQGPDGRRTEVETQTPPLVQPVVSRRGLMPPQITDCQVQYVVDFPGVADRSLIGVEIGYTYEGTTYWVEPGLDLSSILDKGVLLIAGTGEAQLRFVPESLLEEEDVPDNDNPKTMPYETRCALLDRDSLSVAYVHFGPEGRTSEDVYNPSQSSLVENGLGTLGAIRRDTVSIEVPNECNAGLLC